MVPRALAIATLTALGGCASPRGDGAASAATAATAGDAGPSGVTTVRVHYPAGAHAIALRGSRDPLEWGHGVPMARGDQDVFTLVIEGLAKPIELKPLLDDATWSLGPNYRASPGDTLDLYPRFSRVAGEVRVHDGFASAILGNARSIRVYVPPTYLENTIASFPVVYMHDGQNLFDPSVAYSGVTWRVAETMDAAAKDASIAEAIVVGVDNTGDRVAEYTPTADATWGEGGKGEAYVRMVVEELKPRIDAEYRTRPGSGDTAIVGSSLGGLVSAWAGVTRPEVFGLVGALSPTTWWDGRMILGVVASIPSRPTRARRVYVDSGDAGALPGEPPNDGVTDTEALADAYRAAGYVDAVTLRYLVQHGATHDEAHWAERLPGALSFLLGPR